MCVNCFKLLKQPSPPPSRVVRSTFLGSYETKESKQATAKWEKDLQLLKAYNQGVLDKCPYFYNLEDQSNGKAAVC